MRRFWVIWMVWILAAGCLLAAGCNLDPYGLTERTDGGADDGGPDDGQTEAAVAPCIPPGQPEICNGLDDDCDGLVDQDFDLVNDPVNCGQCGRICAEPNADVVCQESDCVRTACWVGFKDLDPAEPGCEYRCPVFPEIPEECNGVDDDCDGVIDEPDDMVAPPPDLCRNTAGTPCENVAPTCDTRGASPMITTWYCEYPPEVEFDPLVPNGIVLEETLCDGHDGDCDAVADDPFTDLGQQCDNGLLGSCQDVGVRACDPTDPGQTFCDLSVPPDPDPLSPRAEECNGRDDNCDGIVDNPNPTDPDRVVDDMVHIQHSGLNFWIYRYEASRPNATYTDPGSVEARPCSNPDVIPWAALTFAQAQTACAAVGKRLCTDSEWLAACRGASGLMFPYGNTYGPDTCNGLDLDGIPGGQDDNVVLPTGDATLLSNCFSEDNVRDLSGNLREWTTESAGAGFHVVRGGGFETPTPGMECDFDVSVARDDVVLPTVGFRCCSDSTP